MAAVEGLEDAGQVGYLDVICLEEGRHGRVSSIARSRLSEEGVEEKGKERGLPLGPGTGSGPRNPL